MNVSTTFVKQLGFRAQTRSAFRMSKPEELRYFLSSNWRKPISCERHSESVHESHHSFLVFKWEESGLNLCSLSLARGTSNQNNIVIFGMAIGSCLEGTSEANGPGVASSNFSLMKRLVPGAGSRNHSPGGT